MSTKTFDEVFSCKDLEFNIRNGSWRYDPVENTLVARDSKGKMAIFPSGIFVVILACLWM